MLTVSFCKPKYYLLYIFRFVYDTYDSFFGQLVKWYQREEIQLYVTWQGEVCYCIKDTSLFVQPVFSSRHPPHLRGSCPLLGHRQTQLILVGGWV